jgi:hypothetical protein
VKLPKQIKKNLLKELEFIIKKMREEPDSVKKIYFFSAVNGALERATRFHFDRELLVATAIMSVSYNSINDRVNRLKMGETVIPFTESLMDQLIVSVSDLAKAIEENKTVYPALERAMEVAYVVSGPGFYTRSFLEYAEQQSQEE